MLCLTLDHLANRYHLLPSEAMARATTFDLHVLDVATQWQKRQDAIARGERPDVPDLSQEEMMAMIEATRKATAK